MEPASSGQSASDEPTTLYPGEELKPGTSFKPQPRAPASAVTSPPAPEPTTATPIASQPDARAGMPAATREALRLPVDRPVAAQSPAALAPPSPTQAMADLQPPAMAGVQDQATTKPARSNPNSTQNSLLVAEVRDGIVIMNDGSFRSVIMAKSVNFDLMSPQEQEAVEYSYQGFLNSLYFPVQIFIRSRRVDLQPYITKLTKIRNEHDNMLLAMMMDDYIEYISQLSQQANIMDKKFYIVVPFDPRAEVQKALTQSKNFVTGLVKLFTTKQQHVTINEADLEKAQTELRNRVQAVLQGLQQAGIQGLPLDTQELIELYYDTYNPDTATRQQLKDFNSLTADVVTKGEGRAGQPHLQRELGGSDG